jgi:hypothetical protein
VINMYVTSIEPDVQCVYHWYDGIRSYKTFKLPKVPLSLAAICGEGYRDQRDIPELFDVIKKDGWREVGWYPSCHEPLKGGYKVHLFCKEQNVPLVKCVSMGFNRGILPLSCSCVSFPMRGKIPLVYDRHSGLGLHRLTKPTLRKTYNNWHRFADTELASYWFWGLLPDETNVHKFEKKDLY